MSHQAPGYVALLRTNVAFRRLWYGQIVSQLGDWFSSIALYTLLLRLTGSGEAVGALLVAQFLPSTVVGWWAGVLIDRLPRRWIMVAADLGRAALVLVLLLVQDASQIWVIYLVTVLKMSLSAFFEPARMAAIPTVTAREELVTANAISGATWSAMLALGAALGGVVAGTLGVYAALLIDSASFLLSALLIWRVPIRETHLSRGARPTGLSELREGATYLAQHRDILLYTLAKGLWSLGGGILLLLTLFGRRVFPLGVDGALSIGLLYAARGVGAGIGPLVVQRLGGQSPMFLRRAIGPAFFATALGYAALSVSPSLALALVVVALAHAGGSTQWVFSSTLLQLDVPNHLQGRIFAIELVLLTLATASSSYIVGVLSDAGWSPQILARIMASVFVITGVPFTLLLWSKRTRLATLHTSSTAARD